MALTIGLVMTALLLLPAKTLLNLCITPSGIEKFIVAMGAPPLLKISTIICPSRGLGKAGNPSKSGTPTIVTQP